MSGIKASLNEDMNGDRVLFKIDTLFKKLINTLEKICPLIEVVQVAGKKIPDLELDISNINLAGENFSKKVHEEYMKLAQMSKGRELSADVLKTTRHDLRAQIGAVIGYSELVLEDLSKCKADDVLKYIQLLGMIVEESKNALPIIDALKLESENDDDHYEETGSGKELNFTIHESCDPYEEEKFPDSTVLIVDDSAYNREILSRRLTRYGVNVLTAENGSIALDIVSELTVDLILLDIMMPVMNGYEVLKYLKSDEKTKAIPVLMISALSEVESIVKCIDIGAEDYLPAPFNPVLLHARIKICLEKKLLRDREQENLLKLEQARQRLETAIESIDDGFALYNSDNVLIMCNERFRKLYPGVESLGYTGFKHSDFLRENYNLGVFFQERRAIHHLDVPSDQADWVRLYEARHKSTDPYLIRLKDGRWIEVTNSLTPDGGLVAVHKDVTVRKKDEERLIFLALHDPLTGLSNRAAFEAQLKISFEEANKTGDRLGVMYLDLDGFKDVNDLLGHEAGDNLLIKIAATLQKCTRTHDISARLGGDEFAILFKSGVTEDELKQIASRILHEVGNRFEYDGQAVKTGISIGIAVYPEDGDSIDSIMAHADIAMYAAKRSGKSQFQMYKDLPPQVLN